MTPTSRLSFFIRVVLIALAGYGCGWSLWSEQSIYLSIALLTTLIILILNILLYYNKVNEQINYFFEAVKNEDFSLAFPSHKGDKLFQRLNQNLEKINKQIQQIHIETQRQEHYFRALIEQVDTGVLSFDNKGFVVHANRSLKKLLGMSQFTHLRQLEKIDTNLACKLRNIKDHNQKLITYNGKNGAITLLLKTSSFKSNDQHLNLITLQDINHELDEKELDSWLKLIRVLTHEIMNSIAPVTSLSENLCNYFIREGEAIPVEEVNEKMIKTTIRGLKVIHEQGQGLTRFVESYRTLTRLPAPKKSMVRIKHLLESTAILCKSDFLCKNINISYSTEDPDLQALIDEKQISRVLINLLKNSAEALHDIPGARIKLHGKKNPKGNVEISVTDNGPGIPQELINEIFIPFFTTREKGSGIGLSLSRQIMRLHNGSLRVRSIPGKETVFTLYFN